MSMSIGRGGFYEERSEERRNERVWRGRETRIVEACKAITAQKHNKKKIANETTSCFNSKISTEVVNSEYATAAVVFYNT